MRLPDVQKERIITHDLFLFFRRKLKKPLTYIVDDEKLRYTGHTTIHFAVPRKKIRYTQLAISSWPYN